MTEERIDKAETPEGNTHTSTTIITDQPRSGISGWFVMFVVLLAVLVAIWAFTQFGSAEMAKDNAITNAANEVGQAAGEVGDAADEVGDAASDMRDSAADAAESAQETANDATGN